MLRSLMSVYQGNRRQRIRLERWLYSDEHCFSVTICTAHRRGCFAALPALAAAGVKVLCSTALERDSKLFAWCFMPDHVHILVRDSDLIALIRLFKGRMIPIARQMRVRNLWQRSFFDHALRRDEDLEAVARYIFANPVRANLAAVPEDYRWSGSLVWPQWREHDWTAVGEGTRLDRRRGGVYPLPKIARSRMTKHPR